MDNNNETDILNTIKSNFSNFEEFNRTKLENLFKSISNEDIINLFNYIPLLLHLNMPDFPGYVKHDNMPMGIYNYSPTNELLNYVRKIHPSFIMPKETVSDPFIEMFALMGSGGTIAFTSRSDFDYWVCVHEEKIDNEALKSFKLKLKKIEDWSAETHNVEVHFFLNDISKIKKNIFDDDDEYGMSGTSLGHLLKEEFLRSSITIAGKTPFWWVVPANCTDETYNEWLTASNSSNSSEYFIDIGNLSKIIKKDFLIAAIFQILKSISNPFKSIIKLGLLAKYLYKSEGNPYISNLIKSNVHDGKFTPEDIDAYLVMFNQVYDHYTNVINDSTSINIIKTCFYLKVDPKLSEKSDENKDSIKIKVMENLAEQWGWNNTTFQHVDNFENWDIDSVSRLLTNTKKFILKGYKEILNSIESDTSFEGMQKDALAGISHKIYSHFMPSENKIDNTLSIRNNPPVKLLNIEFVRGKDKKEFWILSKKSISDKSVSKHIIQKNNNLFNLLVWIALNGLYKKDFTRLDIDTGLHMLDPNFLKELINELSVHFTFKRLKLKNSYYLKNAFPVISYIIINPYSKYSTTVDELVFLYHNSWGETRYESYKNESDVALVITRILNSGLKTKLDFDSSVRITSSYPYHARKEYKSLINLAESIYSFFITDETNAKKRYITILDNKYYLFASSSKGNEKIISCYPCSTEIKMLYTIAYNRGTRNILGIDSKIPELNYLNKIMQNNKENVIQIYFQTDNKYCNFFITDERGSVIFIRKNIESFNDYLTKLYIFAENLINKVIENNPKSTLIENEKKIELYKLEREINHACKIEEINPESNLNIEKTKTNIKNFALSIHLLESGQFGYRFTLPDGEFSEIFDKTQLEKVAKEIKTLMGSIDSYSFFATDINLENTVLPMYKNYTSLAFSEKNRFELMIERSMS